MAEYPNKKGKNKKDYSEKTYLRILILLRKVMEFSGKIIAVLPEKGGISKSGNEWKTQEYVIENHDQYPRKMCFSVFGADKIANFNIKAGEELTVYFDIDCREWNGRWFNDLRAWKVERPSGQAESMPPVQEVPAGNDAPGDFSAASDQDVLPF